jgi:glycerol-3-phosphate O-acyltransferase
MFTTLLEVCTELSERPLPFEPYHERVRAPFDYYKFGLEFTTVLIDSAASTVLGQDYLRKARAQVAAGENVVFLANHQSEGDPYAIDVLFDWVASASSSWRATACARTRSSPPSPSAATC